MVDTAESTEIKVEREQADVSIRDALQQQLSGESTDEAEHEQTAVEVEDEEQEAEGIAEEATEAIPEETHAPLAPPADMNAVEKQAFLNPSPENSHIIQSYLNRRAYETRTQYDRKMQEVNQLKNNLSSLHDSVKQYEDEYAKEGYTIADVTRRSIAWDRAMQNNPVATAREWLESYGLTVDDLLDAEMNGGQALPQGQAPTQSTEQQYLTREQAEKIAEEKLATIQDEQQKKAIEYYNQQVVNSFTANKPLFRDPETAAQLEAEMAPVVQALTSTGKYSSAEEILETAYNYVVNGNPTFSSLMSKMAAQSAMEKEQAKVAKAKAASKSITGSAGSGTPRIESKNIRDNLRRRMAG
jgi:peptidoglycan hydrolase-like protein with peptidoglycan-binding domain